MVPFTAEMVADAERESAHPALPPALAEQFPGVLEAATDAFWESIGAVMRDYGISGDDLGWSGFDEWPPAVTRWVVDLLAGNLPQFVVGARVRLTRDVERYPHFVARKGATGTVSDITSGNVSVKMDEHLPGAEEWDNEVVWSADLGESPHGDAEVIPSESAKRTVVVTYAPVADVGSEVALEQALKALPFVADVEIHYEDMLERGEH